MIAKAPSWRRGGRVLSCLPDGDGRPLFALATGRQAADNALSANAAIPGAQAVRLDGPAEPVVLDGRTVGWRWDDGEGVCCQLCGIVPDGRGAPETQARQVLERMECGLAQAGLDWRDMVRTWYFLDRIDGWYGGFNRVRTAFFTERGVFDRLVPASTGIGTALAGGPAIQAAGLAMRRRGGGVRAVPSPLQGPATAYRSAFSRAVELTSSAGRELLISGTASIDRDGRTIHVGDLRRQIGCTLDVVEALLASRGMRWSDLVRGIAYLVDAAGLELLQGMLAARCPEPPPLITVQADLCRPDLLFELEIDAFRSDIYSGASPLRPHGPTPGLCRDSPSTAERLTASADGLRPWYPPTIPRRPPPSGRDGAPA